MGLEQPDFGESDISALDNKKSGEVKTCLNDY